MATKVKYKLTTGGSGSGISSYENILRCPRKARLDAEAAEAFKQSGSREIITGYFGRGTIYHAFMELYFSGQISSPEEADFEHEDYDIDPEALEVAARTAREYFAQHSRNCYGKVLFNERLLPAVADGLDAKLISEAVGISPFTMRADMAVKIGAKLAPTLRSIWHIDLPGPGAYAVDFKLYSANYSIITDELSASHQATAYLLALNATSPEPYLGMIFDVAIGTKTPKFFKVFVPTPGETERNVLLTRWRALRVFTEHLPDWPNASRDTCFSITSGVCRHHLSGACDRGALYNEGETNV